MARAKCQRTIVERGQYCHRITAYATLMTTWHKILDVGCFCLVSFLTHIWTFIGNNMKVGAMEFYIAWLAYYLRCEDNQ